jgi:hypothetical protein
VHVFEVESFQNQGFAGVHNISRLVDDVCAHSHHSWRFLVSQGRKPAALFFGHAGQASGVQALRPAKGARGRFEALKGQG